jgi:tol-pal system protein YbgF
VTIMLRHTIVFVAAMGLAGLGLPTSSLAQSASEMALRLQQLEEQVRQLTGEVEQLSFQLKQLRTAAAAGGAQPQVPAATLSPPSDQAGQQQRLAAASAGTPLPDSNGVETIQQQPLEPAPLAPPQPSEADVAGLAPSVQVLGALGTGSADPNDGGFQGQVLVPPSQQEAGDVVVVQPGANSAPAAQGAAQGSSTVETVALSPEAQGETPEALYERSNESLLRRQFGDAEAGFSTFLQKYPDHSLAGSAQYWLGETFYAQGDFKRAAANFLQGFKTYPKSRRAPDSLLKLGISLNKLGQGEQACAAFAAVSADYPKAVDARKRAQAEAKRAGCTS